MKSAIQILYKEVYKRLKRHLWFKILLYLFWKVEFLHCAIQRNMVVVLMDSLRVPNQGSAPVRWSKRIGQEFVLLLELLLAGHEQYCVDFCPYEWLEGTTIAKFWSILWHNQEKGLFAQSWVYTFMRQGVIKL